MILARYLRYLARVVNGVERLAVFIVGRRQNHRRALSRSGVSIMRDLAEHSGLGVILGAGLGRFASEDSYYGSLRAA